MPISNRVLRPKHSEAGKIKLGGKTGETKTSQGGSTWRAPVKFENKNGPYFVITKTVREDGKDSNFVVDTALMAALKPHCDAVDGKLRKIPIMFNSSDIESLFPSRLAAYDGARRFCVGDGENPATRYDKEKPREVPCPCDMLGATSGIMCKPAGNLWCTILADGLTALGPRHVFRTHAWGSISAIKKSLEDIYSIVGVLHGFRMWLTVQHQLIQKRDNNWTKIPVVSIMMYAEELQYAQKLVIAQSEQRSRVVQIAGMGSMLRLPAPGDSSETPAEQQAVAQEWYAPTRLPIVGQDGVPYDDDDESTDLEYNPETGEIISGTTTEKPSSEASGTSPVPSAASSSGPVPASQLKPGATGYVTTPTGAKAEGATAASATAPPSLAPPTIAIDGATENDALSTNGALGKALSKALNSLAGLRGADTEDAIKALAKEILADITKQEFNNAIIWKELTIGAADRVLTVLRGLIVEKEKSIAQDAEA